MQNSFHQLQDIMRKMRNPEGTLMKLAPFGYMWTGVNSSTLVASHTIYSMLEKEAFTEFFTVQSWKSYVHPKDLHRLIEAEEELLQTSEPVIAEYRLITETGKHIYVQHHMYLSASLDSKRKIMSIVHNITEQKRAEIILEAMNEGFFELDETYTFRRINEHALKFWGLQHSKAAGKKLCAVFPQMEGTAFHQVLLKAKDKKTDVAQEVQDPVTGHWLHLSVALYADGLIVTFYDKENEKEAERKKEENRRLLEAAKAEKAILEAEQKFRAELQHQVEERTKELKEKTHLISRVTDVMPDLLSVIELNSMKANYINKRVLFEMGFDELEELTDEERVAIIHPDDRLLLKKYFADFATASDDDVIDVEYRARIKTSEWHWFHARGKIFARDGSGKPTHCVNIVQNINKRKNSEQQIEQLNNDLLLKNKQLGSLNAELKTFNSLTTNNYSEMLRHVYINLETIVTTDAKNLSNSSRANLRRAQAAIQKMKLLSNDINNYLQLYESGIKKETIQPMMILQNVIASLQRKIEESNAKINIDTLPVLQADPVLFSKLMTHLIDNSIKFCKENETPVIDISSSLIADTNHNEPAVHNKSYIIITIADNGIGFKNPAMIFELFTQLHDHGKHKGSGMGLAICKKIMEMHGGFITCDGEPEKCASFSCYFPA